MRNLYSLVSAYITALLVVNVVLFFLLLFVVAYYIVHKYLENPRSFGYFGLNRKDGDLETTEKKSVFTESETVENKFQSNIHVDIAISHLSENETYLIQIAKIKGLVQKTKDGRPIYVKFALRFTNILYEKNNDINSIWYTTEYYPAEVVLKKQPIKFKIAKNALEGFNTCDALIQATHDIKLIKNNTFDSQSSILLQKIDWHEEKSNLHSLSLSDFDLEESGIHWTENE